MSDTPKFDHTGKCSLLWDSKGKFLEQNGNIFTYAEYNRYTERYEPEPQWVNPLELRSDTLYDMLSATLYTMSRLIDKLSEVQVSIIHNLEKFVKKATDNGEQDKSGDKGTDLRVSATDKSADKGKSGKQRNRSGSGRNKS
jgi:hypothetical protein